MTPARYPRHVLRYRNQGWAERVGLGELTPAEWEDHFARFVQLPGNLTVVLTEVGDMDQAIPTLERLIYSLAPDQLLVLVGLVAWLERGQFSACEGGDGLGV